VVTADVEEGAAVAEAVLKAVEVVVDAINGAEPQDKACPAETLLRSLSHDAPRWSPTVVVY
jgi:hypothetical protein